MALDLRGPLRQGASPEELRQLITGGWQRRDDRGAEDRLALGDQRAFKAGAGSMKDPISMHTRGG
jgi:cyclic pyranopterin phosphate synthase